MSFIPVVAISVVAGGLAVYTRFARLVQDPPATAMYFNRIYFEREWNLPLRWQNVRIVKHPTDLWIYQEIFHEIQPDIVIETGTYEGGSALYFASLMDLQGKGHVYSVDIGDHNPPKHPRITYLVGNSADPSLVAEIRQQIPAGATVLVALDSNHTGEHVRRELDLYAPLVSHGSYCVVEDTVLGTVAGWQYISDHGPTAAIRNFLNCHPDFAVDRAREKFVFGSNPGGWLRRQ